MNLYGEFVTHKVFGRGQIIEFNDDCITVLFPAVSGKKKFVYPSSFGTFLLPEDKKLEKQIQEYKNEISQTKELEQKKAEQKNQEKILASQDQAKLIRKLSKKTPRKKTS